MIYKETTVQLRIRDVMKEKGLMQKDLQAALGVTHATMSFIVNGKTNPSLEMVGRIANVLQVPIWQLFIAPEEVCSKETTTEPIPVPSPSQEETPQSAPLLFCPHCGKPISMHVHIDIE